MGQHKWIPIEHSEEGKNPSELIVQSIYSTVTHF